MDITVGAESTRPKMIKEAESFRLSIITQDDSIPIIVDMRVKSVHPKNITETEPMILTAIIETELFRGKICFM